MFFHLISNLWKRIKQPGFKKRYTKNSEFSLHLRMTGALVFDEGCRKDF